MTQVGEGRGAGSAGESMTFGAPAVGEILAERYQLEQHIDNDSAGRQVWRGVDIILRRPVAVVMRYPGGPPAEAMLQAAVEASRIVHPNLVGVYDAIDEGARAYVVREWVEGASLRDHIMVEPFDPARATTVAHAVAAAVTAVHASGMTHGNIHPGTVMIGTDGRVVLSDASADGAGAPEDDVRAVGAVLYFALTGYWPHPEVGGPGALPDAPRDSAGGLASPRQVRAGIPDHLDNLAMDLLDRRLTVPSAEILAGEFARIDAPAEDGYYPGAGQGYAEPRYTDQDYPDQGHTEPAYAAPERGPLRFRPERPDAPRPQSGRKIALGVGALVLIGVLGLFVGLRVFSGDPSGDDPGGGGAQPDPTAPASEGGEPSGDATAGTPEPIELSAGQVRIVDAPGSGRDEDELEGAELVVDGDLSTGWDTLYYTQPNFGNLKEGIGVLINLGEPRNVASVKVEVSASGASAELRVGDADPGESAAGDAQILETYTTVGEPITDGGTTMVFNGFDAGTQYQYLLVWITQLPQDPNDRIPDLPYHIGVQQVTVEGY